MFGKIYTFFLYISPLLYLTGGGEYVTPLILSNLWKIPSLSLINYSALFVVLLAYLYKNGIFYISLALLYFSIAILVTFRSIGGVGFAFSFFSQIIIVAPISVFFLRRQVASFIDVQLKNNIVFVYFAYCFVSIFLHFLMLNYAASSGINIPNDRMVGIFKNPNHMAAFSIINLILYYSISNFYPSRWKYFLEALVLVCILLSGSRSAFIFFIILIVYQWFYISRSTGTKILLIASSIFAFFLFFPFYFDKVDSLVASFSRRSVTDLNDVGNMRLKILFEILKDFNLLEFFLGLGSGEGSTVYIVSQATIGEKIVWLDSNVASIIYSYGLVFFVIAYIAMLVVATRALVLKKSIGLTFLYFCYFFWFFNVAEFFPIIFIALLMIGSDSDARLFNKQ